MSPSRRWLAASVAAALVIVPRLLDEPPLTGGARGAGGEGGSAEEDAEPDPACRESPTVLWTITWDTGGIACLCLAEGAKDVASGELTPLGSLSGVDTFGVRLGIGGLRRRVPLASAWFPGRCPLFFGPGQPVARPVFVGGRPPGLTVDGSRVLLGRLDLEPGDVLMRLDDLPLADHGHDLEEHLTQAGVHTLLIDRRGKRIRRALTVRVAGSAGAAVPAGG